MSAPSLLPRRVGGWGRQLCLGLNRGLDGRRESLRAEVPLPEPVLIVFIAAPQLYVRLAHCDRENGGNEDEDTPGVGIFWAAASPVPERPGSVAELRPKRQALPRCLLSGSLLDVGSHNLALPTLLR